MREYILNSLAITLGIENPEALDTNTILSSVFVDDDDFTTFLMELENSLEEELSIAKNLLLPMTVEQVILFVEGWKTAKEEQNENLPLLEGQEEVSP